MFTHLKDKIIWGCLLSIISSLLVSGCFLLGMFEGLELKTFDLRARYFSADRHPSQDVAIILIDEASIRRMDRVVGRWPWPRSVIADIADFLSLSGAKAIVFDILFTEHEAVPLGVSEISSEGDIALAEATGNAGNVYHAAQLYIDTADENNADSLNKPMPDDFRNRFSIRNVDGIPAGPNNTYSIPLPALYRSSKGTGVVTWAADGDGIYRRTRLLRHYQGDYYPVLSMALMFDILKPSSIKMEEGSMVISIPSQRSGAERTTGEDIRVPVQKDGSYLVNTYSTFNPFSMSGVLASYQKLRGGEMEGLPVSPDEFRDKVVFIGTSAVGVGEDLKPTAVGANTPGVYLHASVYSNIMKREFLKRASPIVTCVSVVSLSFIVVLSILIIRSAIYQSGIPFLLVFSHLFISFSMFREDIILDIVPSLIAIIFSWIIAGAYMNFSEGRDKKRIKNMLGQYVSPAVMNMLLEKGYKDVLKAEVGTRERLTILFSDIRGFTGISETMEAEKVVEILNSYLSEMVEVIFRYGGTLDKFIGDAIMAFWGAPVRIGDHGKKAVESALEMILQLDAINERLKTAGHMPLHIGIGINTGEVILGNIGSEKRLDYTIIGDNVNIASRLEGLTKEYGCAVIITEMTYAEIRDEFSCRIVDLVRVVGRKTGIRIFEPLGRATELSAADREIIACSAEGFDLYLKREWRKAEACYARISEMKTGDRVAEIFIDRCNRYASEPPSDSWDGVYTMVKK